MGDVPAVAAVRQPCVEVRAYAVELIALARQLDPTAGWYGVFAAHDPHGLQECLSGREIPPWDVVASLLADLRRLRGPGAAERAKERLLRLHGAAVAAYDVSAGGEPVLRGRLAAAEAELAEAAARVRALETGSADAADAADGGAEHAWARNYLVRVEARCAELRARIGAVAARREASGDTERAVPVVPGAPPAPASPVERPSPAKRRAQRGGSRFAGALDDAADAAEPAPIVPPGAPSPDLAPRTGEADADTANTAAEPAAELAPRGARFAGSVPRPTPAAGLVPTREEIAEARAAADEAVAQLIRLRRAGRGGSAHALLCEGAQWPPLRFAVLAGELQRRGAAPDAGILLWEAAALPPDAFAAAADALCALGRGEDAAQLLRQGVTRPPHETAQAALVLHRAGRDRAATELLAAVLRFRGPAGAAEVVRAEPAVLVGLALAAAGAPSEEQRRRVADALLAAGVPGVPRAP